MKTLFYLVKRNCKVYFKDKGMFFTSLATPIILLVLYVTFLAKVYRDVIVNFFPEGMNVPDRVINAIVGGELVSSLFAVSCITVAFCTNLLMVKDSADDIRRDMTVSPVNRSILAISYYLGSLIATLIVLYVAMCACFIYLAIVGWYLSFADVLLIMADIFLLVLFGTSLSSLINLALRTNGQASAVGTIVSSGYGFICGAYMPLSNFATGLRNFLGFLPGTHGTSIIRNACLSGVCDHMSATGVPAEVVNGIKDSIDCNIYIFGGQVGIGYMYLILILSTAAILGLFVLLSVLKKREKK